MKLVRLDTIFDVHYGTDLELNKIEQEANGIPFVSRNRNNNGVVAHVKKIEGISPNPSHSISVPLGSSSVLFAHYQDKEYYSGRDLAYLVPIEGLILSRMEMFYYCMVLRHNRIKYNYGRQVNTTLNSLLIPSTDSIPDYVKNYKMPSMENFKSPLLDCNMELDYSCFKKFKLYPDIFDMKTGAYYEKSLRGTGTTPLISSTGTNNGVSEMTNLVPEFEGNCITIGKVSCSAFYQPSPFSATSDCTVLIPQTKYKMDMFSGLFIATVLNKEQKKWNYGRQIRLNDCQELEIFLPSNSCGEPDFSFMSKFVCSLKYSKFIKEQLATS